MLTLAGVVVGIFVVVVLCRAARRATAVGRVASLRDTERSRLPAGAKQRMTKWLSAAGVSIDPDTAVGLVALATVMAGVLVAAVSPVLGPFVALAVPLGAYGGLRVQRGRVDRRRAAALAPALERVAAELRAGATVADGLAVLVADGGPLARELGAVQQRVALGERLPIALRAWPDQAPRSGVRSAAGALSVAAELGGRAAPALDGLAASLRAREATVAEADALSAQARLSAVVVGAAPVAFLAIGVLMDAGSLTTLVGTQTGRLCLVVGLGLEALAACWIRQIVRVEAG